MLIHNELQSSLLVDSITYLSNMKSLIACTDEFALPGNTNVFINFHLHFPGYVTVVERGNCAFNHCPILVNVKGFCSISHYETL